MPSPSLVQKSPQRVARGMNQHPHSVSESRRLQVRRMDDHPQFEVRHLLGENHYSLVHEGYDRQSGRRVAIMMLKPEFRQEAGRWDRIWEQVTGLADATPEGVVPVVDRLRDRGWIILKLMSGSLAEKATVGPVHPNQVRRALRSALLGLDAYAKQNVQHGDIKPQNLLTDDRNQTLLSFSPGLILGGQIPIRRKDFRHLAPELLQQEFGEIGPQTDLYTLGFTAMELLRGPQFEAMFRGLNAGGTDPDTFWLHWHTSPNETLPTVHEVMPTCPNDLAKVIDRMTKKQVADRYATPQEVLADLHSDAPGESLPRTHTGTRTAHTASAVPTRSRTPRPRAGATRRPQEPRWRKFYNDTAKMARANPLFYGLCAAVVALLLLLWIGTSLTSTPAPVQLILDSDPPGALIEINGKTNKMVTPQELRGLPVGQPLRVTLLLAGYEPFSEQVTLQADAEKPELLNPSLKRKTQRTIKPTPPAPPVEKGVALPEGLVAMEGSKVDARSGLPLRAVSTKPADNPLEFVLFTPGLFRFGVSDSDRRMGELAERDETVSDPFYLSVHEVTEGQFLAFLQATGQPTDDRDSADSQRAAGNISYEVAQEFAQWVSSSGRLPSEIEWEYAARGTTGRLYPWGNEPPTAEQAALDFPDTDVENPYEPRSVLDLPASASPEGLTHLVGNLAEWTSDAQYKPGLNEHSYDPGVGKNPVVRGGSYLVPADEARLTYRANAPAEGKPYVGMRVLVPAGEPQSL